MENNLRNLGPIIKNYTPISSKGGAKKRKSRRVRSRKSRNTHKLGTRRRYR
jgi:hypothetical protein